MYRIKRCCALLKASDKYERRLKCYYKAKKDSEYCGVHKNYDSSIPPPPDVPDNTECVICLEKIKTNFVQTKCNHYFHTECLAPWKAKSDSCPCCRNSMTAGREIANQLSTSPNMSRFEEIQNDMRSTYYDAFNNILSNMSTLNLYSNVELIREEALRLRDVSISQNRPIESIYYTHFANHYALPRRTQ